MGFTFGWDQNATIEPRQVVAGLGAFLATWAAGAFWFSAVPHLELMFPAAWSAMLVVTLAKPVRRWPLAAVALAVVLAMSAHFWASREGSLRHIRDLARSADRVVITMEGSAAPYAVAPDRFASATLFMPNHIEVTGNCTVTFYSGEKALNDPYAGAFFKEGLMIEDPGPILVRIHRTMR